MSLATNIANMFRPTQQVTVAAPPPAPMAQTNPGAAGNAPVPASGAAAPNAAPAVDPNSLDAFADVWKTPPQDQQPQDPFAAPLLGTDPNKITQAAAKMDMTRGISPEMIQKAMSGQDPQAFMAVMNQVAQNTLATATQITTATTEHAHRANNQRMLQALPDRIKQTQLDNIQSENPVLQHAAVQPMLKLARQQIKMNNPGMSAEAINRQAEAMMSAFATALVQPSQQQQQQQLADANGEGFDWDASFLGSNS